MPAAAMAIVTLISGRPTSIRSDMLRFCVVATVRAYPRNAPEQIPRSGSPVTR
jgi:hypothetical protein